VIGNDLVGVGLASSLLFGPLTGLPPEAFDSIEPNCDGARVRNNLVVFNGLQASNPLVPSGDLVWDGTGTDNHWRSNIFLSSAPRQLPF
jgi:hypothetical protein